MAKHFRCFMLLNCCLKCFILLTLNGSPRSRVPAMFSSAFWKWQHSFSPNVRQGVCANVLLQCVLRYRGRWGQPLHLSSTLNYNTTYNHPPELSSGVPPLVRGQPRDLRQSAISDADADKKQSVATRGQLAVTAQYCHQCCPITAHLNTRVVNEISQKFTYFFNRAFSLSKVPTTAFTPLSKSILRRRELKEYAKLCRQVSQKRFDRFLSVK